MSRWQPTRAGITNIWRYFDEVFTFDHGRLLLRGPNGSGKSKALEVLLPFLLDANLSPSRLSTFGTTARTMHWNLMGEGASGRTRIGFVWLEFGRDTETVTIGARLQATRETTRVDPVYFITHLGVPDELRLVDADGAPLSVAALEEAVRGNGDIYRKARDYRTAVRELLFPAMGAERYDTLVQALLQLRRPKLSEHLDPEALSGLLSNALPPVDAEQIRELAEGFERLDQQRAQLVHLNRQERAAHDLSNAVAAYSRGVIRARAVTLTQATTALDNASAAVRHGEEQREDEQAKADAAAEQEAAAKALCGELAGSKQALERSDAYAEGRNLDDLRRRAADARTLAHRTAEDAKRAKGRAEISRDHADADAHSAAEQQRGLAQRIDEIRAAALALAISEQDKQVELPPVEHLSGPDGLEAAESWSVAADVAMADVAVRARARLGQVTDALGLLQAHDRAIEERDRRETEVARASERVDKASEVLLKADRALQQELAAHEVAVLSWADRLEALSLERGVVEAGLGAVHSALSDDAPDTADENALRELASSAVAAVREADGRRQGELAVQRKALQGRLATTAAERERLTAARFAEPERSIWRDAPPTRGAPLWRLVDSRPDAPADQIAAVEAALQAAGLLDAWVLPDGSVELPGNDVILASGSDPEPAQQGTLLELLVPDPHESDVRGEVIAGILGSIGLIRPEGHDPAEPRPSGQRGGRQDVWVSTDGRWRLGVQHGRWHKPQASYLGATARERHRQAQLAELAATMADLVKQLQNLSDEHDRLRARITKAAEEAAALPPATEARNAARVVAGAADRVVTLERLCVEAIAERTEAELAANAFWTRFEAEIGRCEPGFEAGPVGSGAFDPFRVPLGSAGMRWQVGPGQCREQHWVDPDPAHVLGCPPDPANPVVEAGHVLVEVADRRVLHLAEHFLVHLVGAQESLQVAVEGADAGSHRVQVAVQLLECRIDASLLAGRLADRRLRSGDGQGRAGLREATQSVRDGVEHGGLQHASGLQGLQCGQVSGERSFTAPGQRILQIAPLVFLRRAVVLRVVLTRIDQLPLAQLVKGHDEFSVVDHARPPDRGQMTMHVLQRERGLE